MDITIVMLDGNTLSLRVNPEFTVGSLKMLIQSKLGFPPEKQKLIFVNGEKTQLNDDSQFISHYGLQSGSEVSLLITEPPVMQVFLRNEKDEIHTYDIKPEETVNDFKTKVQHREGVPVSQQRLLHKSTEMTTGRLSNYGVREKCTIDLMLRLRGG